MRSGKRFGLFITHVRFGSFLDDETMSVPDERTAWSLLQFSTTVLSSIPGSILILPIEMPVLGNIPDNNV
jgi:hypothetical protein